MLYFLTSGTNSINCWFANPDAGDRPNERQQHHCARSTPQGHGERGGWGGTAKAIKAGSLTWTVKPELMGFVHFCWWEDHLLGIEGLAPEGALGSSPPAGTHPDWLGHPTVHVEVSLIALLGGGGGGARQKVFREPNSTKIVWTIN